MVANRTDVKLQFEAAGITISEWSKSRGYNPRTVYAVLSGQLECKRGISHRIAVDLGLKRSPEQIKLGFKVA